MDCSRPGFPVLHYLLGFVQTCGSCSGVIIHSTSFHFQNKMDDKLYGHPVPKPSSFSVSPVASPQFPWYWTFSDKSLQAVMICSDLWMASSQDIPSPHKASQVQMRYPFSPQFQFSCSVVSNSLQPHGLQHARLPCPSSTTGAYSNSCPLSRWCHTTISSSVVPFSSCLTLSQHQGLSQWISSSH